MTEFNPSHRLYLEVKDEISQLITTNQTITEEIIDLLVKKLSKLSSEDLSLPIKLSVLTILFLEELYINKNSNRALTILKSLPKDTDISIRQNLSSLLLQNDAPNVFLASLRWKNINSIGESRNLLIENLFGLLPSSVYLFPNGIEMMLKDASNYQQLSLPSFNSANSNLNSLPINLKQTLNYHTNEVWFIKYSPNGKYLATGSKDTKIIIYDVENNYKLESVFQLHTESITYLSWNSSSTELLSLSFDQTLKIWSIELNKCIKELDNKKSLITQARLSTAHFLPNYESNNQILVASNDGKLFIVSLKDKLSKPELISEFTQSVISPQIQDLTIQNNFIYGITITNELLVFTIPDLKLIYKMQFNQMPISITSVSSSFPGIPSNWNLTSKSFDNQSYVLVNLKPNSLALINTTGISSITANKKTQTSSNGGKLPFIETFFHLPSASSSNYIIRGCAGGNYNPANSELGNTQSGLVISGGKSGEIWLWGHQGNVLGCVHEHEGLVNCVSWRGDSYTESTRDVEWASGSDDGKVCIWGV